MLLASAAREILAPLGFQQKGRSRTWFADEGWWLTVVEFQPSSWSQGSYLNVAAKWLWRDFPHWSFDFTLPPSARVRRFSKFEGEDQFKEASRDLAHVAATEVLRLRAAFPSISAVADVLIARATSGANPHTLYDAATAAYLAGRSDEAIRLFAQLSVPQPNDSPNAEWLQRLRRLGAELAAITGHDDRLLKVLTQQVIRSRKALVLSDSHVRLPRCTSAEQEPGAPSE